MATTMNGASNGTHASKTVMVNPQDSSFAENGAMTGKQPPQRQRIRVLIMAFLHAALILSTGLLLGSFYLEYFANTYLIPQMELMHFTETGKGERGLTYYHRVCDEDDMSTTNPNDFIVAKDTPTEEALDLMLKHGVTLLPGLLRPETVEPLREFILKENQVNRDLIYVIENENRWSFPIQVDQDPSVTAALEELLSNEHLVRLLEAMCGPDPAVIEFTAITAAEGATQQYWHQDVTSDGSAAKYARHFIPSYSLFIPLQNTTSEMGATGICPGTHMCSKADFCETAGFQVSGKSNLWPIGAGALVNQQTTHRGEAHTSGPHRVVFILTFAPRPRVGPFEVETRMIGTSGSYSLHWSQWGHTLSDFRQPLRHMKWRILRSLGLYKPKDRLWGWDYVMSSLMRITHEEFGFGEEDLETFLKKGGIWWLPKFLQGSTSFQEDSIESIWTIYLRNTLKRCQALLLVVYSTLLIGILLVVRSNSTARGKPFKWILAFHGAWLIGFFHLNHRIHKSPWARNIRNKLSNHVPSSLTMALESTRTTLPDTTDIMRFDKMKSRDMHSFERVLEVAHPGNAALHATSEHYSIGYGALSKELQYQLRMDLYKALEDRRFLAQTSMSDWTEMPALDRDLFLHETLLPDSLQRHLLREVASLLSESRFGYHRNSAMHQSHIPQLLGSMYGRLLTSVDNSPRNIACASSGIRCETVDTKGRIKRSTFKPAGIKQIQQLIEEIHNDDESQPGRTFLAVGDAVDAIFGRDFDYWYLGRIVDAKPIRMEWVVEFDDGDIETNACVECVVPHQPFFVGETVEIQTSGDGEDLNYETGQVVAVYGNLTTDVTVEGDVHRGIRPSALRRPASEVLSVSVGDRVYARFPGAGPVWYAGSIERINDDGTLAIHYDDGDYHEAVPAVDVRVQSDDE